MKPRIIVVNVILVALFAGVAEAQPTAWIVNPITAGVFSRTMLLTTNLATGETYSSLEIPSSVTVGGGALTPDGQYYLLATSLGIARFRTTTRELVGRLGPELAFSGVAISPSSSAVYATTTGGIVVLHPTTGSVIGQRPASDIVFARDGTFRYEIVRQFSPAQTLISAFRIPAETMAWSRSFAGVAQIAAAPGILVLAEGTSGETAVLDAATGVELSREPLRIGGLVCCSSDGLIVGQTSVRDPSSPMTDENLVTLNPQSLSTRVVATRRGLFGRTEVGGVSLSSDGSVAYWRTFNSLQGLTVSSTSYEAIELASGERLGGGRLGSQRVSDFDVEPGIPCVFDLQTSFAVPASGGVVRIPVSPRAACGVWSASALIGTTTIANPGPHQGPATIDVAIAPTTEPAERVVGVSIGGRSVAITQPGSPPGTPSLTFSIEDRRVTLTWTVGPGGSAYTFVVRGGQRGAPLQTLAITNSQLRTWRSEALPQGSYAMEVVARGFFNGDGPPSNRVAFSIDAAAAPLPPTDVVAMASDTTVAMSWLPAATGEAPGSYIIEAAPAGSTTFATAAVAQQPSFFAMRLPAGDWQVRIRAMNSAGTSGPSNVVALRTARCTSAPASPQQLTVTPIGAIPSLRWIPPSSGPAESYILEVGTTSGSSNLGRFSVTGAATAYEVSAPVGVYYVRVRASNGCGNSALSNEVIAVSGAMP